MSNNGYFNIQGDNIYPFFCQACLVGKPLDDASPDSRYCQGCYDYLLKEADMLSSGKCPKWIPKTKHIGKKKAEKLIPVSQHTEGIMATVNDKKSEVAKIKPTVRNNGRGRKQKQLPIELIMKLADESMGSKRIASRLNAEGIEVGFRTVARIISGER